MYSTSPTPLTETGVLYFTYPVNRNRCVKAAGHSADHSAEIWTLLHLPNRLLSLKFSKVDPYITPKKINQKDIFIYSLTKHYYFIKYPNRSIACYNSVKTRLFYCIFLNLFSLFFWPKKIDFLVVRDFISIMNRNINLISLELEDLSNVFQRKLLILVEVRYYII